MLDKTTKVCDEGCIAPNTIEKGEAISMKNKILTRISHGLLAVPPDGPSIGVKTR
jgi:hypothetical protein